jgi:hypothetical protein
VLCDGRAAVRWGRGGWPIGLGETVLDDLGAALDLAEVSGLRLILTLFDYPLLSRRRLVKGVALGGRRRAVTSTSGRALLMERVLDPLARAGAGRRAIHSWDLMNEPEWVTFGLGAWDPRRSVGRRVMRSFLATAAEALRRLTQEPVTVGLASTRGLGLVRGLGLDYYQVHWYDRLDRRAPLDRPVADLGLDAPLLLGEFPTRGSGRTPREIVDTARRRGFSGALAWSLLARDAASSRSVCEEVGSWA